jgi:hypothetical protein
MYLTVGRTVLFSLYSRYSEKPLRSRLSYVSKSEIRAAVSFIPSSDEQWSRVLVLRHSALCQPQGRVFVFRPSRSQQNAQPIRPSSRTEIEIAECACAYMFTQQRLSDITTASYLPSHPHAAATTAALRKILLTPNQRQGLKILPLKKSKVIPVTGRGGPQVCETSRLPHVLTIGSQMAVRLSALRAGRPLPPRKIPGTHFC